MKRSLIYLPAVILSLCITSFQMSCNHKDRTGTTEKEVIGLTGMEISAPSTDSLPYSDQAFPEMELHIWPCFHGLNRQNKSDETGLLTTWPSGGPELAWSVSGLGEGYASVSIAGGMIFTAGVFEDQSFVFAFDLDGKLVWKMPNGSAWKVEVSWARGYDGPRSTPTYDSGRIYHLSEAGNLTAYEATTGEMIWSRNLMSEYNAQMPEYGFTESVLVKGDKLFVKPAGRKGFQVCLNKLTGETIWTNQDIPGSYAYNSPVLHDFGGYRMLISGSSSCYYGIDAETGRILWKIDFENPYEVNCTDAVVYNDYVVLSSGETGGTMLARLQSSGRSITAERVWKTELMDNYHGGIILHDCYLYGSGDKNRGWFSLELLSGKQMWKEPGSMGSLTFADGMLYLFDENGKMRLVEASPERFEVSGEFRVPRGGAGPFWAHPVVCGGRLYLRHAGSLYVYDISSV